MMKITILLTCLLIAASGPGYAEDAGIFSAMESELGRTMRELRLGEAKDTPYYVGYTVIDREMMTVAATFGSLTESQQSRERRIVVNLRVGNYEFDNRSVPSADLQHVLPPSRPLPIEDDTSAIRRAIWLATDDAFKQAMEQMSSKRAAIQRRNLAEDPAEAAAGNFSRETGVILIEPRRNAPAMDRSMWERYIRDASMVFRLHRGIRQCKVKLAAGPMARFLVDSEGRRILTEQFSFIVEIEATAKTADGQILSRKTVLAENDPMRLPYLKHLVSAASRVAQNLDEFRKADRAAADYSGPVLLAPPAAAVYLSHALVPSLSGGKSPVMPAFLMIHDDPLQKRFGDKALIGSRRFDDEGVECRKVSLIENGILKNFLMSRTPMRGTAGSASPTPKVPMSPTSAGSNGHGFYSASNFFEPRPACLFVEAGETSFEGLKEELIRRCKERGLEAGYIVAFMDASGRPSVLAYRLSVSGGKPVPVRGFELRGWDGGRDLGSMVAAGSDVEAATVDVSSAGRVPYSIVCPSLLFGQLELTRSELEKEERMILDPALY